MWKCLVISGVFTLASLPSSFRCGQPLRPRLASTRTGPCCILCLLAGWSQSLCCLAPALLSRIQHPYRYTHTQREGGKKRRIRIKVCDSGFGCERHCPLNWTPAWKLHLQESRTDYTDGPESFCVCVCVYVFLYMHTLHSGVQHWIIDAPAWTKREDAQGQADSRSSCCLHALLISTAGINAICESHLHSARLIQQPAQWAEGYSAS